MAFITCDSALYNPDLYDSLYPIQDMLLGAKAPRKLSPVEEVIQRHDDIALDDIVHAETPVQPVVPVPVNENIKVLKEEGKNVFKDLVKGMSKRTREKILPLALDKVFDLVVKYLFKPRTGGPLYSDPSSVRIEMLEDDDVPRQDLDRWLEEEKQLPLLEYKPELVGSALTLSKIIHKRLGRKVSPKKLAKILRGGCSCKQMKKKLAKLL